MLHEDRLAVVQVVRVRGDLDPLDRAALPGLVGQREPPDEPGVLVGELLHLARVVAQLAVAGPPAGQRRGADAAREARGRGLVPGLLLGHVGDDGLVGEALAPQDLGVVLAVEHDRDEALAPVLGHVQAGVGERRLALTRGRGDVDERRLLGLLRPQRLEVHAQAGALGRPPQAAGLDAQPLAGVGEPLGHLVGSELRGGRPPAGRTTCRTRRGPSRPRPRRGSR